MKQIIFFLVILYSLAFANTPQHFKISYDPDYAPYSSTVNGKAYGLFIDIYKKWAEKNGYQVAFVQGKEWDDAIDMAKEGSVDFFLGTNPYEKWMHSSKPYYKTKTALFSLQSFEGIPKTIGIIGDDLKSELHTKFKQSRIFSYDTYKTLIDALTVHKVDAIYDDSLAVSDYIVKHNESYRVKKLNLLSTLSNICAISNDAKKVKIFDAGFQKLSEKSLMQIENNWVMDASQKYYKQKTQKNITPTKNYLLTIFSSEEILFALFIVLFLSFVTYKQYTKNFMVDISLKKFTLLIIIFEFSMILFLIYEIIILNITENRLAQAYNDRYNMTEVIYKLRQSSDDLTNFARTYAVTGNKKYQKQYFDTLAIRNGTLKRPRGYDSVYWDLNKTLRASRHPLEKKIALRAMMNMLPFFKEEFAKLKESEDNSNDLVHLETKAFQLLKEHKEHQAAMILHSPQYFRAKQKIMLPIDDLTTILDKRTKKEIANIGQKVKMHFIYIFLMGTLFVLGNIVLYFFIHKKINQPIEYLTNVIQAFQKGKTVEPKQFHNDEIGSMIEDFFQMQRTIELKTDEIEAINKHTRESIEYAALIQSALMPENKLFRIYFQDYFAIWHPKDIVGGDIYLFDELRDDDECLLMLIDCTGHGVPGAFVTMLVKAIERQIIAKIKSSDEVVSPAKILSLFNRSMKHLLKQENIDSISNAGFDGAILYYNKKEKIVRFAGAQTPLFYVEDDIMQTIKGERYSVGYKKCDADYEYKEHIIKVKEGMEFYLTTDGYLDQNGGVKGFPFGKRAFKKIIEECYSETMADQQEVFLYELDVYQGEEERNDDITVIGLKI